jgi:hypothetical protein
MNLPILVQNALIALAGGPGRTAMMMRNQITKCRNSRAQLLSGTMTPALDAGLSFSWRCRSRFDLGDGFQLTAMFGLLRRFDSAGSPAGGRRREAPQRQSSVSSP